MNQTKKLKELEKRLNKIEKGIIEDRLFIEESMNTINRMLNKWEKRYQTIEKSRSNYIG